MYLEKIKGARLVFYRCTKRSCRTERVISALLLALFAKCIFYTWECATEDQFVSTTLVFLAPVLFFIVKAFRDGKTVITTCDHVQQHEDEWGNIVDQMDDGDGVIEAGTVVNWGLKYASGALKFNGVSMNQDGCSGTDKIVDHLIEVQWDCGHKQRYSKENKEWNLLRVFDMGPTGMCIVMLGASVLVGQPLHTRRKGLASCLCTTCCYTGLQVTCTIQRRTGRRHDTRPLPPYVKRLVRQTIIVVDCRCISGKSENPKFFFHDLYV